MNNSHTDHEFSSALRRITGASIAVNLSLAMVKGVMGLLLQSFALLADALDSLSDLLSDGVVFWSGRMGRKPPDEDHHFGHGKFETFGELVVAMLLLAVGGGIIHFGVSRLFSHTTGVIAPSAMGVAFLAIAIKEWLYRYMRAHAGRHNSSLILTQAWHQRSDALSSLVVVIGALCSYAGVSHADAFAGVVIGFLIATTAIQFLLRVLRELSEGSPGKEWEEKAEGLLKAMPKIRSYHRLRLRKLGSQLLMDMHVMVNPELNLREAHDISIDVEVTMKREFGENTNVLVHVEPFEEGHRDL